MIKKRVGGETTITQINNPSGPTKEYEQLKNIVKKLQIENQSQQAKLNATAGQSAKVMEKARQVDKEIKDLRLENGQLAKSLKEMEEKKGNAEAEIKQQVDDMKKQRDMYQDKYEKSKESMDKIEDERKTYSSKL